MIEQYKQGLKDAHLKGALDSLECIKEALIEVGEKTYTTQELVAFIDGIIDGIIKDLQKQQ